MKKNRIGILTFHETLNYGAVLQAFALEKKIELYGENVEIINYRCNSVYDREFPQKICNCDGLKEKIKLILGRKKIDRKKQSFSNFSNKFLKISKKSYCKNNINADIEQYDTIIVGSDQVWNCLLTGGDTTYFLDFINSEMKAFSYAASFGYIGIPEEYKDITAKGLNNFKRLSVREESGVKIVEECTGKNAALSLDPTLLIDKKQWCEFLNLNEQNEKNDYILVYLPHDKKNVFDFAKKLSKKTGLKIVYVNITYIPYPGVINCYDLSPKGFLEMIMNARYIVTGSFHGVAFSINFEKHFFYESSAASGKSGSRVDNLVSIVGLEKQKISDDCNIFDIIDYKRAKSLLSIEKKKSEDYLYSLLN